MSMYGTLVFSWILALGAVPAGLSLELAALSSPPHYPEIPILMDVTVANKGSEALSIPTPSFSSRDNAHHTIEIYTGSAPTSMVPVRYVIPDFSPMKDGLASAPPDTLQLAAGESWTATIVVSHDWQPDAIVSLLQEDKLLVEARFRAAAETSNSAPGLDEPNTRNNPIVEIPFHDVSGPGATALQKLRRLDKPWLLAHPAAVVHVTQDKDFRAFQELARMSPSSPYTAWAQMVVAYMMARGNAVDLHGNRPPQPRVAGLWMDEALKNSGRAVQHPEWAALKKELDLVIATTTP